MYNSSWLDGTYTLTYVKTEIADRDNVWRDGVGTLQLAGGTGSVDLTWQNQRVADAFSFWLTDDDSAAVQLGNRNYSVDIDTWNNTLSVDLDMGRDEYTYVWTKDNAPAPTPPAPTPPAPTPPAPTPPPVTPALDQYYAQYFNAAAYLQDKTDAMNQGGLLFSTGAVAQAIANAGLSELQHFQTYGAFEVNEYGGMGINPSAGISLNDYYVAKQALLQSAGMQFTVQAVVEAFQAAGLDPIEHYVLYGQAEGLTLTGVRLTGIDAGNMPMMALEAAPAA